MHIAYQVSGSGPQDIVFVQGYITHLELEWSDHRPARLYEQLGKIGRLIRFDKRGTGLSDRVGGLATLEERMDDVRAVMDAVGSERAILLGSSEGGPMSLLFCATYPQRVQGLVLYGAMARFAWAPDNPWGRTAEAQAANLQAMERNWGTGSSVDLFAPSEAADPANRSWRAQLDRAAASPGAAVTMSSMNFDIDVRHVLPSIRVPTLILHRRDERAVNIAHSRYLARQLPHARYVELPGRDHAPWVGDTQALCDEIQRFATDISKPVKPERILSTIMVAEFAKGTWRPGVGQAVQDLIVQNRGRLMEISSSLTLAAFDGPARAVRCGQAIQAELRSKRLHIKIGLHTGECEVDGPKLHGVAVEIARRIAQQASAGEMLVSSTVRDLVAGSGLGFEHRGVRSYRGLPGKWTLLSPRD